ncbi:MAG: UDP-N-acetylglucosamine 1-carboxyvinyltransferase [Candidatus Caccovivens sp.]
MNEKLLIMGGHSLNGIVKVSASKNAFLPILAGTILCDGEIELKNLVHLSDIENMCRILNILQISTTQNDERLYIDTRNIKNNKISNDLTQKVRASIFMLGALLGRFRSAVIAYPGGCKIGARPIDIHIKGFKALGARVIERHGYIYCHGQNLKAGTVVLDFPSVGATESLMMCATLLKGTTVLKNTAKEPEIVDLQNFLNACGAKIVGAGTDCIVVEGVEKLHGCSYVVMPDRIEAGTFLLAAATCSGDVLVDGAIAKHNESLLSFLRQTACQIKTFDDKIRLKVSERLSSIEKIETMPYPYFPTDLQAQMMTLQAVSRGVCLLKENIFENRFSQVAELRKMGADIVQSGQMALIKGVERLYGADVYAGDLRAGASLVMAGLKAEGYTSVYNVHYIDRGYEKIEEKFSKLGADIKRI